MRSAADVEAFVNDLDTEEVDILVDLIADLDPLYKVGDAPKYNAGEINLILRFQQFVQDHPVDTDENFDVVADSDGFEAEDVDGTADDSGDIPGTGEDVDLPTEAPASAGGAVNDETVPHRI